MEFISRYVSHQPDEKGYISYTDAEHQVWQTLYERQVKLLPGRACGAFIHGLDVLGMSAEKIPQLPDISRRLYNLTQWQVAPVAALISAREFFELLSQRHFPAATFIRSRDELNYVKEPDIFHELFGHCPMLTNPVFADFVYNYACKVLTFPESEWPLLQRLFWFTVEFGLIRSDNRQLRAYGGGILSSISETVYSVESEQAMRVLFDPVVACRIPYRIDQLQPVYFVIDDYQQLYDFVNADIGALLARAHELGEYPPFFDVDENNPNIHLHAC